MSYLEDQEALEALVTRMLVKAAQCIVTEIEYSKKKSSEEELAWWVSTNHGYYLITVDKDGNAFYSKGGDAAWVSLY